MTLPALFKDFFAGLSFVEGVVILLAVWVFLLYKKLLKDRQRELDRLAVDNHDYRDRFERLHDKIEHLQGELGKQHSPPSTNNGEN